MKLKEKVAIITGGARGIGQCFASRFAKEGAKVVVADVLDTNNTMKLINDVGGEGLGISVDVSNEKEVLEMTHAEIGSKVAERWPFSANLIDVIGHHHDCAWTVNPTLGKILHCADKFTFGEMDFSTILESFSNEGMNHPATWDSSDLASVEQILQEEMGKAQSMFRLATDRNP